MWGDRGGAQPLRRARARAPALLMDLAHLVSAEGHIPAHAPQGRSALFAVKTSVPTPKAVMFVKLLITWTARRVLIAARAHKQRWKRV